MELQVHTFTDGDWRANDACATLVEQHTCRCENLTSMGSGHQPAIGAPLTRRWLRSRLPVACELLRFGYLSWGHLPFGHF